MIMAIELGDPMLTALLATVSVGVGLVLRPWFALLCGSRIRRDDAELARKTLFIAQRVFKSSVERSGALRYPWKFEGNEQYIETLANALRTVGARCHDRNLRSYVATVAQLLVVIASQTPRDTPTMGSSGAPMSQNARKNQERNQQIAGEQLQASNLGITEADNALARLDWLERRLTFWEGRLS